MEDASGYSVAPASYKTAIRLYWAFLWRYVLASTVLGSLILAIVFLINGNTSLEPIFKIVPLLKILSFVIQCLVFKYILNNGFGQFQLFVVQKKAGADNA